MILLYIKIVGFFSALWRRCPAVFILLVTMSVISRHCSDIYSAATLLLFSWSPALLHKFGWPGTPLPQTESSSSSCFNDFQASFRSLSHPFSCIPLTFVRLTLLQIIHFHAPRWLLSDLFFSKSSIFPRFHWLPDTFPIHGAIHPLNFVDLLMPFPSTGHPILSISLIPWHLSYPQVNSSSQFHWSPDAFPIHGAIHLPKFRWLLHYLLLSQSPHTHRMKKYQNSLPHTETRDSGISHIPAYLYTLGGLKSPGVCRGERRVPLCGLLYMSM